MSESPPLEWLVENFVYEGKVTFCPYCRSVPLVPLAGGCACGGDRTLASLRGGMTPWQEEELLDPSRLYAVENEDRPGDWGCFYEKESS